MKFELFSWLRRFLEAMAKTMPKFHLSKFIWEQPTD